MIAVVGCAAASQGDQGRIDAWGLIHALPLLYFLCAAALTLSFFLELFGRRSPSNAALAAHVVGLVLLLHGAPGFLEQEPRFATALLHAGFTQQILDRGVSRPEVDARFDWPGFFGAAAAVTGAAGLKSPVSLVRWAPVFMVLLYLPSLYVIGRHLTRSATTTWVGLWLFVLVNWVGQDYFAPQSLGLVLYLAAVAIMVTFFRRGQHQRAGSRLSRWRRRFPADGGPDIAVEAPFRVALIALLVALAAALAMSHPLSPIAWVIGSAALVLVGRSRLTPYPVVAAIVTLGWLSLAAKPYWTGHRSTLFGGIGDLRTVLNHSVGDRLAGSAAHMTLVNVRLAYTLAVWAVMVLATAFLSARRTTPVTLLSLAVAPFAMVFQSYGTEGILRIYLFSAPFACLIIAQALQVGRRRATQVALAIAAVALVPLFVLTRYGNESFEQVRPDEMQAIRTLFTVAPPGSELVSPTSQVPWRFDHATDYEFDRVRDPDGFLKGDPAAVRALVAGGRADKVGTYLVITTSQQIYASEALGAPVGWFDKVRPLLTPANGYRLVYRNADAGIYQYRNPR